MSPTLPPQSTSRQALLSVIGSSDSNIPHTGWSILNATYIRRMAARYVSSQSCTSPACNASGTSLTAPWMRLTARGPHRPAECPVLPHFLCELAGCDEGCGLGCHVGSFPCLCVPTSVVRPRRKAECQRRVRIGGVAPGRSGVDTQRAVA